MQRTYSFVTAVFLFVVGLAPIESAVAVTSDPAGSGQSHENHQPGLGINYLVATAGAYPDRNSGSPSDPDRYVGEMTMFAGNFAPQGWAFADGQLLPIATHSTLFSLFGTFYGGDGRTTFALPDLRGRSAMKSGNAPGLSNYQLGQKVGVDNVTLSLSQMPSHDHPIAPPIDTSDLTGSGQSHTNLKPSLAINYFMPLTGGEVRMAGFNFAPNGNAFAEAQLLSVSTYPDLFSRIGTIYGGNGLTTFALPDLRGRLAMHEGQGTGLTNRQLGDRVGVQNVTLTESNMPVHGHTAPDPLGNAGGGQAHENVQPTIALNYIIATSGLFPSVGVGTAYSPTNSRDPFYGEIRLFAGSTAPAGWEFADGQSLLITSNFPLFSLLGTTYGGDGRTTFKLPDLRGRVPVHVGGSQPGTGLRVWTLGEKDGQEMVALTLDQFPTHTHTYTIPGDLDGDGFVGITDLNLVLSNWNQAVPPANPLADTNNDGYVGIEDLNLVLGNWNAGTPPVSPGETVPEPAMLTLLAAGCLRLINHRRVNFAL